MRVVRCTPERLAGLVAKDLQRLSRNAAKAFDNTIEDGIDAVVSRAPKAFGDLRGSVHKAPMKIVVDAPHAAAVEVGSMPHMPDMEALTAWVKLRGMQGLTARGNIRSRFNKGMGPTTPEQATRVAEMLKEHVVTGSGGKFSPADAPHQVALAIAKGIKEKGTRPHWFVRDSLPTIQRQLAKHMRRAMGK